MSQSELHFITRTSSLYHEPFFFLRKSLQSYVWASCNGGFIFDRQLADSTEQNPSWEADSHSPSQEIPLLLWNPKFHDRVHNTSSLVPILSPMYRVYNFSSYLSCMHSNIILSSTPGSCVTFRNKLVFYGEEFYPISKLEDHPLSAVRDCSFNTFTATHHIWSLSSLPPAQRPCRAGKGTTLQRIFNRYDPKWNIGDIYQCRSLVLNLMEIHQIVPQLTHVDGNSIHIMLSFYAYNGQKPNIPPPPQRTPFLHQSCYRQLPSLGLIAVHVNNALS
jgi:hypothetical protein